MKKHHPIQLMHEGIPMNHNGSVFYDNSKYATKVNVILAPSSVHGITNPLFYVGRAAT